MPRSTAPVAATSPAGRVPPAVHGAALIEESLAFEQLLVELSARFIDIPSSLIDEVIEDGLRRIVETLRIDRSSLTLLSGRGDRLLTRYSWAVDGVHPVRQSVWALDDFPWLMSLARANKALVFSRLDELPPEAAVEKRNYAAIGMRSHIAQPVVVAGEIIGILGFGCIRREYAWPPAVVERTRALADVFGAALARKNAEEARDRVLGFERLATKILGSLLTADRADDQHTIDQGLREIGQFMQVERVILWERLSRSDHFRQTHQWRSEAPGMQLSTHFTSVKLPWISERLVAGEIIEFNQVDELRDSAAADVPRLRRAGIRSLLAVPITVSGQVAGALSFANIAEDRLWPAGLVQGMTLLAEVFAGLHTRQSVERRKLAAELEASQWRERLAHVVRVHTAGAMSAALAHEITQPLGAIENYALAARRRIGEDSPDIERVADLIDKVITQTTRAGDVVLRMRSMVQRHELDPKEIDVERAVRDCCDMVKMECDMRDIQVQLAPCSSLPPVLADEIHIQQVILNLLRNAMEAVETPLAGVARSICIDIGRNVSGAISVKVADRGPGIAEGDLERVFDAFYSTKASGLGIGLSICRKLIEAHGGELRASHNPAGGAVFEFTLPVAAGPG